MKIEPSPFKTVFVAHCPYCQIGSAFGEQIAEEEVTVGYCDNCNAEVDSKNSPAPENGGASETN